MRLQHLSQKCHFIHVSAFSNWIVLHIKYLRDCCWILTAVTSSNQSIVLDWALLLPCSDSLQIHLKRGTSLSIKRFIRFSGLIHLVVCEIHEWHLWQNILSGKCNTYSKLVYMNWKRCVLSRFEIIANCSLCDDIFNVTETYFTYCWHLVSTVLSRHGHWPWQHLLVMEFGPCKSWIRFFQLKYWRSFW